MAEYHPLKGELEHLYEELRSWAKQAEKIGDPAKDLLKAIRSYGMKFRSSGGLGRQVKDTWTQF